MHVLQKEMCKSTFEVKFFISIWLIQNETFPGKEIFPY